MVVVVDLFDNGPPRWVKARARCSLRMTFLDLRGLVERDVADMNCHLDAAAPTYEVIDSAEGAAPAFFVSRVGGEPVIRFECHSAHVAVALAGPQSRSVTFHPEWDDRKNRCRMHIDAAEGITLDAGAQVRLWKVSRAVLSPVFFPPWGSGR